MSSKTILRQFLLSSAHKLVVLSKQLQGAADKLYPQKRIYLHDLEAENWETVHPCFVLSTGRSGTRLLNNILELSPECEALHEPKPELFRASRLAYESIDSQKEVYREVFKSAREEYLLNAARHDRKYIETNNQVTFFAPIIRDVFPNATFIHLVRHPGDFVRSGIRRKWYTGNHSHDAGRIVPTSSPMNERWNCCSDIEKIGWLWNETNQFVESFRATLDAELLLTVNAEDFFADAEVSQKICEFLRIDSPSPGSIRKQLKQPANPQRKGTFPNYVDWSDQQKGELRGVVTLAEKYGYEL